MKQAVEQLITRIEQETFHDERLNLINELEHLIYIQGDNPALLRIVRVLYDVNAALEEIMNREELNP